MTNRLWTSAFGFVLGSSWLLSRADAQQLPDVQAPAGAAPGDFLSVLDALLQQGITIFIFIVGAAAFLLVGWSVIAKFNECRAGRAEWSEAAVTAGVGAVILVFATFLLTQANTVFA